MNELNEFIQKTNWYLLNEYFIDIQGNIENNNVVFNWYFESFSNGETFQCCAGRINSYLKPALKSNT